VYQGRKCGYTVRFRRNADQRERRGIVGFRRPDRGDLIWDAFAAAMRSAGPVVARPACYGGKPALVAGRREIARCEAPRLIELRITQAGWSRASAEFGHDPAVWRDPARPDWLQLHLRSVTDVARLSGLLVIAMTANV
jgi:hypothetical protein